LDADSDDSDYEDPKVVKQRAQQRVQRLFVLLPKDFPDDEVETYVVHHDDFNAQNILVDHDGELTGIIDWECVHAVPLWLACQIPKFLEHDMERKDPPDPDAFPIYTQDDGTEDRNESALSGSRSTRLRS
jgi:Ser/Thr protein kinase RdoA (MazF antagonist)